jgi:hypothetical protein
MPGRKLGDTTTPTPYPSATSGLASGLPCRFWTKAVETPLMLTELLRAVPAS